MFSSGFSRICLLYFDPSLARFTESSEESDLGLGSQLSGKIDDFLLMKGCLHPIFSNLRPNVEKCCPSEAAWGHENHLFVQNAETSRAPHFFCPVTKHQEDLTQKIIKNHPLKSHMQNNIPSFCWKKTHLRMGEFSFRNPRPSDRKELSRRGRPSVRGVPAIFHKVLSTYAEWDVSVYIYINTCISYHSIYIYMYIYTFCITTF